ncbi:hypothetical protein [Ectopseudomonas composti]|uniref:hypothetical protein n=1 Tax=Ectopseudomonas composti TaxID=658457 RepID=UPI0009449FE2|nr:hypothetical protein [Pseudomonas composti]
MAYYDFLFTYSVSPIGGDEKAVMLSDKVRKKIADIDEYKWSKLDAVETTFAGELYLTATSTDGRRDEAERTVKDVLRAVVDECEAFSDVWVKVALMLDKHGVYIEFKI